MQDEGRARQIVILDCDVHQGNGTAAIFAGDPTVYTFSIHGEKNFPYHKECSSLDIPLPDGTRDDAYLQALQDGLERSLDAAGADIAIYLAGADPFEGDKLGRLALSKHGLAERDRLVFTACRRRGLPVAVTMAGGYAKDINDTAEIHLHTVRIAVQFSKNGVQPDDHL
jgi:acetoin utilization deacetylase AcuC-like enzyme